MSKQDIQGLAVFSMLIVMILVYAWNEAETRARYERLSDHLKSTMVTTNLAIEGEIMNGRSCEYAYRIYSGNNTHIIYYCKEVP